MVLNHPLFNFYIFECVMILIRSARLLNPLFFKSMASEAPSLVTNR